MKCLSFSLLLSVLLPSHIEAALDNPKQGNSSTELPIVFVDKEYNKTHKNAKFRFYHDDDEYSQCEIKWGGYTHFMDIRATVTDVPGGLYITGRDNFKRWTMHAWVTYFQDGRVEVEGWIMNDDDEQVGTFKTPEKEEDEDDGQ